MVVARTAASSCFTAAITDLSLTWLISFSPLPPSSSSFLLIKTYNCRLLGVLTSKAPHPFMLSFHMNRFQLFLCFVCHSSLFLCQMRYPSLSIALLLDRPTNRCPGNNVSIKALISQANKPEQNKIYFQSIAVDISFILDIILYWCTKSYFSCPNWTYWSQLIKSNKVIGNKKGA